MPRPNRSRTLRAEVNVAQRIARERERKRWTYEGLASRLTAAGCPIQPSAIYKIEKGDPPRRITVDELVAFATVFGVPVNEMLQSPDSMQDPVVTHLAFRAEAALRSLNSAVGDMETATQDSPDRRTALRRLLRDLYEDWPEMRRLFQAALKGEIRYGEQPQENDGLKRVVTMTSKMQNWTTEGGERDG